jgi:NADPH:quinone reductase-like Zn-dependent oxidoreductase
MNRAVIHEKFGGREVLELREFPEPHAGLGEVRVRAAAAGLNPMDRMLSSLPEVAGMAKLAGVTVIGTGSEGTFGFLRELGAEPVAYGAGLAARVRALAPVRATGGRDAAGALDLITGDHRGHDHRADRRDLPDRADPRRRDAAARRPRPRQDRDDAVAAAPR